MSEQKIKWSTVIFSPRHYPIELVAGESFWMYDQGRRIGFYTHAGGGWRTAGAETSGGSPSNPVLFPDGVNLTWLAPVEGKYYNLRVKLPKDKILQEFSRKLSIDTIDKTKSEKFQEIQFALSPGGFVSLRIGWAEVKEIAYFQATEVDISWDYFAMANHFNPEGLSESEYIEGFIKELPEKVKQQMQDNTLPTERWKNFSTQKFPWHLATSMDLYGYSEFLINGDKKFITKPELNLSEFTDKQSVPAWYRWYFKQDGKRYKAIVRFSQNDPDAKEQPDGDVEVFELFKTYFASHNTVTALVIDIIDDDLVAYLTNGTKKQELPLYGSSYRLLKEGEYKWFK